MLSPGKQEEDQSSESCESEGDEADLDPATLNLASAENTADPVLVQRDALEQQDRKEVPALMGHQPPHQPATVPGRSFGCEGDRSQRDVRVGSHLVRVRVVAVVFALPPAVAHPDQQVRDNQADPIVPPARLKYLTVRGVMAQERDLGHQNREDAGVGKLPPAVADPNESYDPGGQDEHGTDQLGPVVAVAAAHQSHLMDAAGQRGERTTCPITDA